jgi:hypothetical protein
LPSSFFTITDLSMRGRSGVRHLTVDQDHS